MLEIENLHAHIEEIEILQGINLTVLPGEIHAIMGPNGAGKSTLAKILAGHPDYTITKGDIRLKGESILELEPEERAHKGLFMSFQYPPEIPGMSNRDFLFHALNALHKAHDKEVLSKQEFIALCDQKMEMLEMHATLLDRPVNEGFSGGEKKRNEILQMALLNPLVSVLDETDSGLDIDAMRIVAEGINKLIDKERCLLVITHYQRLLNYIKPDYVHILEKGKIVRSGDAFLAQELEEKGYACSK